MYELILLNRMITKPKTVKNPVKSFKVIDEIYHAVDFKPDIKSMPLN